MRARLCGMYGRSWSMPTVIRTIRRSTRLCWSSWSDWSWQSVKKITGWKAVPCGSAVSSTLAVLRARLCPVLLLALSSCRSLVVRKISEILADVPASHLLADYRKLFNSRSEPTNTRRDIRDALVYSFALLYAVSSHGSWSADWVFPTITDDE